MSRPALQAVLARLRARFAATAPAIIATLTDIADRLEADATDAAALDALVRESHRVHGTAGSHGFHDASRLAGEMERSAAAWLADPALEADARGARVRDLARALAPALRDPAAGPP